MDTTSTSMTTITDLSPENLCLIFDKLPLIALVHIDEVSRNWGEQKLYAFSQRKELNIYKNKETLHLIETSTDDKLWLPSMMVSNILGFDKLENFLDQNALYTGHIPPKMVDNIIKLMPNLTVIRIFQKGSFTELWKIKFLLDHYRRQLVEVNISFIGIFHSVHDHLETSKSGFRDMFLSLISTLNNLEKLNILVLWLKAPKSCTFSIEMDLSVVNRLKKFSVMSVGFNDIDALQHTLQTYARENKNLQIGSIDRFRPDTLLALGPRVLSAMRVVNLGVWIGSARYDAFKQLARQCPNLKSFYMPLSDLSMAQVAEALLPCRSLICLMVGFPIDVNGNPLFLENSLPLNQLPVLSSVKCLVFSITTTSHRDLEKMNLEVIFPNVQVIKLVHILNRCQDCNFTVPENIAQSARSVQNAYSLQIHECQRLTRLSFAKFSKLTKLAANIGLEKISSSYICKVLFTPEKLDRVTYSASGEFIF